MDQAQFASVLAQCEQDEAVATLREMRALLLNDCLHYGAVHRKFNGGRGSLFCDWCGAHIGDLSAGQVVMPLRVE